MWKGQAEIGSDSVNPMEMSITLKGDIQHLIEASQLRDAPQIFLDDGYVDFIELFLTPPCRVVVNRGIIGCCDMRIVLKDFSCLKIPLTRDT